MGRFSCMARLPSLGHYFPRPPQNPGRKGGLEEKVCRSIAKAFYLGSLPFFPLPYLPISQLIYVPISHPWKPGLRSSGYETK